MAYNEKGDSVNGILILINGGHKVNQHYEADTFFEQFKTFERYDDVSKPHLRNM